MINTLYLSKIHDEGWYQELFTEIWDRGYVVLHDFLSDEGFQKLLTTAQEYSNRKSTDLNETAGGELGHSPEIMSLFNELYKIRCAKEGKKFEPLNPQKQMMGFPYKDARDGKKTQATEYHYDGAYVNATLALMMPRTGGELIAFPNLRTSKNALLIKIFSRALRHIPFLRQVVPHVIVRSTPNDLCLFFGDRTFHGVEPIGSGERLIMTINAHW